MIKMRMEKLKIIIFILSALMIFSEVVVFAGNLSFDGEIRTRFEDLNGLNKKAYGDTSVNAGGNVRGKSGDNRILSRIIAGFTYSADKKITYRLHMYDGRVWGWSLGRNNFIKNRGTSDQYVMDSDEDYFEFFDANIKIKDIFTDRLSLVLGRQRIYYGDHRIFGPGNWGNAIGWLWDAVHFTYNINGISRLISSGSSMADKTGVQRFDSESVMHGPDMSKQGDFITAWYGRTKFKDPDKYSSFFHDHVYQGVGIYSHFSITLNGAVEPFFAWKNSLHHKIYPELNSFQYGIRLYEKKLHGINYDFTFVKRCGSKGNKSINAYAYVAKVGYRFDNIPMTPNFVIGRVFASGDSNPHDKTIGTYTRIFGSTTGEHYGRINIISWSNLVDNQVDLSLRPVEKVNVKIAYHNFSLDKAEDSWEYYQYTNKPGNHYTHLGNEIDFELKYHFLKNLQFHFIYAYFKAGDFVKHNVENNNASTFFMECTYKFRKDFINPFGSWI